MSSRFLSVLLIAAASGWSADARLLRVCADPNNLPYSNDRGEGFENRVAELIARELDTTVQYTWAPQRLGFVRKTLNAGECDVVMDVPSSLKTLAATRPYYRSSYVFVSRDLHIRSFDDPRLAKLRIGLQMAGGDYTPPAYALSRRGLAANVTGFSSYTPAAVVEAVTKGDIDVAIVWGPLAAFYGKGLEIAPVGPATVDAIPLAFDMSMGVRKSDTALRDELDRAIASQCGAIQKLLEDYRIPREGNAPCASPSRSPSAVVR